MKTLLIIFVRNPILGQVKTRLANKIGAENALLIYQKLLEHTAQQSAKVLARKEVWYSQQLQKNDVFNENIFDKNLQTGKDLGARMETAFKQGFAKGFTHIVLIGSDLPGLNAQIIEDAFRVLQKKPVVFGPAKDGGYYLVGLNTPQYKIFKNIKWGGNDVLADSLSRINQNSVSLLEEKNDIDTYEDFISFPKWKNIIP